MCGGRYFFDRGASAPSSSIDRIVSASIAPGTTRPSGKIIVHRPPRHFAEIEDELREFLRIGALWHTIAFRMVRLYRILLLI